MPSKFDPEYIASVRFNPLADYKLQIKPNKIIEKAPLADTTLGGSVLLDLAQMTDDDKIGIKEDKGNFPYAKIVTYPLHRDLLLGLMPTTQSLFLWLLFQIEYRSEIVEISLKKVNKSLKISANTLNQAIAEMETINIIKRVGKKRKEDYWHFFINPQFIWKGDAKKYYKDVTRMHPEYLGLGVKAQITKSNKQATKSKASEK